MYRTFVIVALITLAVPVHAADPICREVRKFSSPQAIQGVGIDTDFAYVVTNRAIAKHHKLTGRLEKTWEAPKGSYLKHLNSGVVVDGVLYSSHSNYPTTPRQNSIEMWDAETLEYKGKHEFKRPDAAFTWIDIYRGKWYGGFAYYGDEASVAKTEVVLFDKEWKTIKKWHYPQSVVKRFSPYSNSGASFGPDGLLYATGHDAAELYAVRLPEAGGLMPLVATVPMPIFGQGIAWDRTDLGIIYGIRRKNREVVAARFSHSAEFEPLKTTVRWQRDARNPILPPSDSTFDSNRCMNPWVIRDENTYKLYYSGGDKNGRQRICLATADVSEPGKWTRQGPLFDVGKPGHFDARWCVLPHVVQFNKDRWHLYFTGNAGHGSGLSSFPGIGLAISKDAKSWKQHSDDPVLKTTGFPGDPDAIGVAGGSLVSVPKSDGETEWRFYYTGCPTVGRPHRLNQQKTICMAVSNDGINWQSRGAVLYRDPQRDYEDIGVAGPVVQSTNDGKYRMWYSAIGNKWGYYSICFAESDDGIHWTRGSKYGDNLQLTPQGDGWEKQMVEYPSVIAEGDHLRLFYCGNGYGSTGIGTATGKFIAHRK